jgi:hypothetical protein
MLSHIYDKTMDTISEIAENDKTLIIFVLLIYGVVSLVMRYEGAMSLIEKLASGLLGMAIGRSLK